MFKKKIKCSCGKKIDVNFNFCPYCGAKLKTQIERDKALDKEVKEMVKEVEDAFGMPFFMKFPFEKLVKKFVKDIEKQFQEYDELIAREKIKPENVSGISISIKQSPNGEPIIQVKQFGNKEEVPIKTIKEEIKEKELPKPKISEAEASKLAKLPREEPETKVRRLSDKIVYEIALPGVKSEKDIIINKLQNSIEIKAFAKDKAYFKLIPLGLPIKKYRLDKETLILELKPY